MALVLFAPLVPSRAFLAGGGPRQAEITMWFDTTGGSETADCMVATAIDPFNEQGGTQVEATLQANNWDATRTALAGGAGPDVVTTPGPSFAFELAKAGQLLALDDIATQQGWAESFVPWALEPRQGRRPALLDPERDRDAGPLLQQDPLRGERLDAADDASTS